MSKKSRLLTIETEQGWHCAVTMIRFAKKNGRKKYNPTKASWQRIENFLNNHHHTIEIEDGALTVFTSYPEGDKP